jgi:hypothetical protein
MKSGKIGIEWWVGIQQGLPGMPRPKPGPLRVARRLAQGDCSRSREFGGGTNIIGDLRPLQANNAGFPHCNVPDSSHSISHDVADCLSTRTASRSRLAHHGQFSPMTNLALRSLHRQLGNILRREHAIEHGDFVQAAFPIRVVVTATAEKPIAVVR